MRFHYRPLGFKFFCSTTAVILCSILFFFNHFLSLTNPLIEPLTSVQVKLPPSPGIPQRIWYKLGPKGLSEEAQNWTQSWLIKNPSYRAEFMTDESGDAYVQKTFASHPDIVESYLGLSVPILKADLLRYLLLFAEGGIWSDLDVSCDDIPIDDWIPEQYKEEAGLVVGWEFDVGWGDNFIHQFASWTIMAKPGLPHMLMVIEDIIRGLRDKMEEHNVALVDLQLSMVGDVVDFTGPRRLTRSVFSSLEQTLNKTIDYQSLWQLLEPKLVGDVLILPGFAFAASMNKYEEIKEKGNPGPPLVTHHYAGTWKNEHGGEEV